MVVVPGKDVRLWVGKAGGEEGREDGNDLEARHPGERAWNPLVRQHAKNARGEQARSTPEVAKLAMPTTGPT